MKRLILGLVLTFSASLCFGQKGLLSYDDIKFLLHNNLAQADTFLTAKEYLLSKKDNHTKNRKYTITFADNTYANVDIRLDGKKIFIEMETNALAQYNLIHDSIVQYIDKNSVSADVQTYTVKDLGTIYITVNDTEPYDPLKRDYDLHIVADKNITTYN